jgi:MFS family permease
VSAVPTASSQPQAPPAKQPNWKRRGIIAAIVLAVLLAGYFIGAAAIPRWWAQQVGDQVDGDLTRGLWIGFIYGFLFTLLPLLVLFVVFRYWRHSWKMWLVGGLLAAVLLLPNLMTLGVVIGSGSASHAGQTTMDVRAPWFRGGTLIGVLVVVAVIVGGAYFAASRRKAREHKAAEVELQSAEPAGPAGPAA